MNFKELEILIDSMPGKNIPAADCAVYYKRTPVFRHITGYSDIEKMVPLSEDNLFYMYSASKVTTCVAALQLYEKGLYELDDPLSEYLPEFKNMWVRTDGTADPVPAKNPVTIRQLFTMSAGLTYDLNTSFIEHAVANTNGRAPLREIVKAIASNPLAFEPGTHYRYSLCHDILGGLIEVLSGEKFGNYIKKNIFDPVGMNETGFKINDSIKSRIAWQYYKYNHTDNSYIKKSKENPFLFGTEYESGGAGLISSVNDYVKLADVLSGKGLVKGNEYILHEKTVDLMRTNQLDNTRMDDFKLLGKKGYGYGLGVRTMVDPGSCGAESPAGEFGWDGAMGAFLLADPINEIAVFYAQHESGAMWHHEEIRDTAYRCIFKK